MLRGKLLIAPSWMPLTVGLFYAATQGTAQDSYYTSKKDLPHWLTDEQRLYIEKQSYRPAITKEEFKQMSKEALKREHIKKVAESPFGRAFISIGSAIAHDDLEYSYTFQKPEADEGLSQVAKDDTIKKVGIKLENATGITDDPELKAAYTVEQNGGDKVWAVEAVANPDDSQVKMRWGWKF